MTAPAHPTWCSPGRCTASGDGPHESDAVAIKIRRRGEPPRILLLLWAPRAGQPVRLRIVAIGQHLVNTVDLDLDSAHLAANTILKLLDRARPPERVGPTDEPD